VFVVKFPNVFDIDSEVDADVEYPAFVRLHNSLLLGDPATALFLRHQ